MNILISVFCGFAAGLTAWFCSNYFGKSLIAFWDLRLEAHKVLYYYANIDSSGPLNSSDLNEAQTCLRWLAARADSLQTESPWLILKMLSCRGYDLSAAAWGLTNLSNKLTAVDNALFRVQAQRALKLPRDSNDEEYSDVVERLKGVPL
jgi:hypothetical protein